MPENLDMFNLTSTSATETSEKTYVVQWLARKIRNYARRYAQAQSWVRAAGDDPEKQETIKNHQAFLDRAYSVRLGTFLRDTANYVQDVTLVVPLWHLLGFPKAPDTTKWGEYKQPATKNIAGRSLSIAGVRTLVNLIGKLHIVLTTSPDGAVHYGEGNKSGGLHFQARGGWLFIALPINERGFEQFGGSGATVEHELEHAWDAAEYKLDNSAQLDAEYTAYIVRPSEVRARTREVLAGVVNGLNSDVMKLAANKRRLIKAGNGEKAEDKIHDMRQAMYMTWGWLGKDETIREVVFNDFGFWDANKNAALGSAILWDKFLLPLSEQARQYKSTEAKSAQEYVYQALCRLAVDIRAKYKNVTTIFDYTNKDKEGDQE